jgi:hypothetical protein
MHWNQFAREQPGLAALGQRRLGQQRLGGPGVVLVGTVGADGTARISPVEPLFWEDDLWLSWIDVEGVSFIRYDDASGDQFVTKATRHGVRT